MRNGCQIIFDIAVQLIFIAIFETKLFIKTAFKLCNGFCLITAFTKRHRMMEDWNNRMQMLQEPVLVERCGCGMHTDVN
jgi:hypothetical protein